MRGPCGAWAHQDSPVSAQAVARGAARCASQVLSRGAQAVARGAARRKYLIVLPRQLPRLLDRSTQNNSRDAAKVLDRGRRLLCVAGT
jgi:hypothetical protein